MVTGKDEVPLDDDLDASDFKALQKQWLRLAALFNGVARAKSQTAKGLDQLDAALAKIPDGEALNRGVSSLKQSTEELIRRERKSRQESFRKIEADLIRGIREEGTAFKELDGSWRIGPLELEVRREHAQARVLYNREQILGWTGIAAKDDLRGLFDKAGKLLNAAEIAPNAWADVLWRAYQNLAAKGEGSLVSTTSRVPLPDFYREARLELLREELASGKPDKKLKDQATPRWAFLYNLDLYRRLGSRVEKGKRLAFETGSQKEQTSGKGMVLNGLDPREDYRVFCFVTQP